MIRDSFEFIREPLPQDGELKLVLVECAPAETSCFNVPMYTFHMHHRDTEEYLGRIRLRVGWTDDVIKYAGQIGYAVEQAHRGHHYAERACRLIGPLAHHHDLRSLWITCQPDNAASRRTLERLGAEFVGIVDVPKDYPLDAGAIRQKACYRWTSLVPGYS